MTDTKDLIKEKITKILENKHPECFYKPTTFKVDKEVISGQLYLLFEQEWEEREKGFEYEHLDTQEEVRSHIQQCEGHHMQQAIYSTFHDGLTQVCFGCRKVRSTL